MRALMEQCLAGHELSRAEAFAVLQTMVLKPDPVQTAAFLGALRAKGEAAEEVTGMAEALRARMTPLSDCGAVVDTCGTGGDGAGTVNISTGAALLAAAAGARVVKHGNRAVSGSCGSADVLAALGISIELTPTQARACLAATGFTFCYAPLYHPAMRAVAGVRRALGFRTVFNLLGPLCNPARPQAQLLGVASLEHLPLLAICLRNLGVKHALVVHTAGVDELAPTGVALAREVRDGVIRSIVINPEEFGIPRCELRDLQGGAATRNAQLLREAFHTGSGPIADAIALNAGYALYLHGTAANPAAGIRLAYDTLRRGAAVTLVEAVAACSSRLVTEKATVLS